MNTMDEAIVDAIKKYMESTMRTLENQKKSIDSILEILKRNKENNERVINDILKRLYELEAQKERNNE